MQRGLQGTSGRSDAVLTEAFIKYNAFQAQKIFTWEKKKKVDSSYTSNSIK